MPRLSEKLLWSPKIVGRDGRGGASAIKHSEFLHLAWVITNLVADAVHGHVC